MPQKKQWVVRIVQTVDDVGDEVYEGGPISDAFLESLRYANLIVLHHTDPRGLTARCFDLVCPGPYGLDSQWWAEANAKRMRTFGFNAAAAPAGHLPQEEPSHGN